MKFKILFSQLAEKNKNLNSGRGVRCVHDAIHCFENGNLDQALGILRWDFDKLRQYGPEFADWVYDNFVDEKS